MGEFKSIIRMTEILEFSLTKQTTETMLGSIPKKYALDSTYMHFFFDKGKYLHVRYESIVAEMAKRGLVPTEKPIDFPMKKFTKNNLYNDWKPTKEI